MMLLTSKKCWIPLAIFLLVPILTYAQDLHYTQFYNAPHTYNPAHVGVYSGDQRIQGSLRDQWRWVPVPWFTFGMAYDQKIYPKKSEKHFWSIGGNLNYDRQGDSRLTLTGINANGTYSRILNKNNILTAGLTLGFSLPMHLNFSMIGSIYLLPRLDLQLHGLHQMQGEYRETIIGGLGKIYVNNDRGNETELHVGLGYRLTGSLAPTLAIQYRQIYVGASYDTDRTDFNTILEDNKGGPEFHVRYTITHVKPLKEFKVCPIY